jgi:predicted nucleic acid-binding Zn finger protein
VGEEYIYVHKKVSVVLVDSEYSSCVDYISRVVDFRLACAHCGVDVMGELDYGHFGFFGIGY